MKNEEFNLMPLIELEQTIISGISEDFKQVQAEQVSKYVIKQANKLGRNEDVLRLLGIYLNCYSLPKRDY